MQKFSINLNFHSFYHLDALSANVDHSPVSYKEEALFLFPGHAWCILCKYQV